MKEITLTLDSIFSYFEERMSFIAEQIMLAGTNDSQTIASILKRNIEALDKTKKKFHTDMIYDFVNPEGYTTVTAKDGILKNPIYMDSKRREWRIKCPMDPWRLQFSFVDIGILTGNYAIPFGYGITDKTNKFLGILTSGVKVEKLREVLEELIDDKTYRFIIFDNKFRFVVQSSNNLTQKIEEDVIKNKFGYLLDLSVTSGSLYNSIKINGIDYLFYAKSSKYPYVVLFGIDSSNINTNILQKEVDNLLDEKKYKKLFFKILLYYFKQKVIHDSTNQITDNLVLPVGVSKEIDELIPKLWQIESYEKLKEKQKEELINQKQHLLEQRETFFKSLVHDLRNPLGQLEGALGLLQTEGEKEEYNIMQSGINNIKNLVDGILLIAKLESGNLELNKTNIDLSSFVDDIIKANKFTYALEGIDLTKEMIGNKYISVSADEQILERCIANLLSNARKFTKKGCVKIIISKDEKNKEVIINVKDTGEGIKKEDIPKILEEFGQTEEGKKQKSSTGIGLPTVKKFIELHDGRLEIESEVGKGSEFKLILS